MVLVISDVHGFRVDLPNSACSKMPINRASLAKTSGVLGLRLLAPPNPFVATPTLVRPVRRKFKAAQSPGTGTYAFHT